MALTCKEQGYRVHNGTFIFFSCKGSGFTAEQILNRKATGVPTEQSLKCKHMRFAAEQILNRKVTGFTTVQSVICKAWDWYIPCSPEG